jgi:Concanavalin A-like lectin/glucanases superfamily
MSRLRVILGALLLAALTACPCQAQSVAPNWGHPLLRGIVAWWRGVPGFTNGDRFFDLTGNRYHATLTNMGYSATSGWSATDRKGGHAQINGDGINDYVDTGQASPFAFPDTTFTAMGWFRATTLATVQYLVAERIASVGTQGGWFLRLQTTGTIQARIVDTGNANTVLRETVSTLAVNTWFHIAAVFTTNTATQAGNDVTLYLNGVLDQTAPTTGTNPYVVCGCNLVFGVQSDNTTPWLSGAMDDILIYNRGLTALEIATIYSQSLQGDAGLLSPVGADVVSISSIPSTFFFFPP